MKKVLILNGPNLNMLGKRPKEHYGALTLEEINQQIILANDHYFDLEFYQSNSEGDLVTYIQNHLDVYAIIINPAAYTHTSIAILDALEMFPGRIIEVHLSKVDEREDFRRKNYIRPICEKTFQGRMVQSYIDAIQYLKK